MAHFLQSVSSGLVLGGELVYHRGRAEEGGILTLAGQYSSNHDSMFNRFDFKVDSRYFILSVFPSPGPNWVATLNAGKGGAHASYYHRANKQVVRIVTAAPPSGRQESAWNSWSFVLQIQIGVEFEASTRTQETTTSFGYQMELPEANMVFRGRLSVRILL